VWKVREIGFLGVIMGPEGFQMEKEKVEGVTNWPTPQCVKDVQKFLGLANYYRRFVKDFAKIAKLLHQLVRRDEKWNWGSEQEEAFTQLKEIFMTEPVLAAPDLDKEMRVEADALDYTTGEMLSVKGEDGRWRLVAFISKLLNNTEKNYKIHDKEMLAVIRCLETWRHFLEGARTKFKIWMDHKNLEYFMTNQKLNRRQARWALFLSRFDFALKRVPGNRMGKADGLSRRPDWRWGTEKDNEDRTLVKAEWLRKAGTEEVLIEGVDLLKKVRESKAKDGKVIKAVEEMKRAGVKMLRDKEWRKENGLMLKERKIYMPKDEELRTEIIWLHHNTPIGEHGGQWKTVELITRNFWWLGVTKKVKRYVEGCDSCQRNKN